MRVLSVDVGCRNLGVCEIETGDDAGGLPFSIGAWDVVSTCDSGGLRDAIPGVVEAMRELLAGTGGEGWDAVVIENQPAVKNPTMKAVQVAIHAFVATTGCSPVVHWAGAGGKNAVADTILRSGRQSMGYRESKKRSVDAALALLQDFGLSEHSRTILGRKKRDDLADSLLQGVHFVSGSVDILSRYR